MKVAKTGRLRNMLRTAFRSLLVFLLAALSIRADLTLRYTTEVKTGSGLPAAAAAAVGQQLANVPKERFVRIKGDKTQSTSGALTVIMDNAGGEITLLNPAAKQYARIPMADLGAVMQKAVGLPAASQQALQSMKLDIDNKRTGQMGMVAGLRAEEHLLTMTMSMNLPAVAASAAPMMRLELHTWVASQDELNRIPLLREYAASAERAARLFGTSDQIEKMFSQIPGLGEKVRAATEEMSSSPGSLTVKTTEAVYSPMMAQLGQLQGGDANAPLMELQTDLAQISTDSIDDSFFTIPADYEEASSEALIKALNPAQTARPGPPALLRPDLGPNEPIERVGAGVSAPSVVYKEDPEYTEAARKGKIAGAVLLSVVVDSEGLARNIKIVRSLDAGLDQKAIESVSRWKFRPGQKDGQPVNVRATIEINFRLVDPPQQ